MRTGGRVQVVTTALKLLPMVAVAMLGGWLLLTAPATYTAPPADGAACDLGDVVAASTIALFAMLGLESATVPAARVKDPGTHDPARDDGRHAADGGDLPDRLDRADDADPAGGTRHARARRSRW